jgi:tetratricopeptide (TPR) repeat protein
MAVLLDESGQKKRAAELFAMLAPDDRRGNSDAHRRLAGILSDHITPHSDAADVKRLYWHLTMATDSTSPQISVAWGRYYIAIGDLKSAKTYFQKAVERFPALWKAVGAIEMKLGNRVAAENSFQRSSAYLAEKLEADPKRERIRADYAEVLIMQGRLDEAEIALKNGKLLNPDGSWARLLAALAVSHHDMASTRGTPVSELLRHLDRALEYDPNNAPALSRLMSYSAATVDGNAELRTVLARVIADGKQPALAHVAMGNLCLLEDNQDQAIFHFETAMRLRNDIAMLLNNLAWLLAHEENAPDLKRAMALVNSALEQNPDHPEFLDTRATIFLLQKDWKAALIDLERALDGVRDKKTVHQKLTTVYIELGFNDIAEQHRLLSERPTRIGL